MYPYDDDGNTESNVDYDEARLERVASPATLRRLQRDRRRQRDVLDDEADKERPKFKIYADFDMNLIKKAYTELQHIFLQTLVDQTVMSHELQRLVINGLV